MSWKPWVMLSAGCLSLFAGPLDNWQSRTNLGDASIAGIAHHEGVYVLIGLSPAQILTLTNLTEPESAVTNMIPQIPRGVAYGAGRFVVVGDRLAMSSTNGYDWESHTTTGSFNSLIFANDRFVAVGSRVSMASTNGTDWTMGNIPVSFSQDVIFGNGIFLASNGSSNAISSDGITWEGVAFLANSGFYIVGFGEGKFVGVTIGSDVMTSTDGRTWTKHGKIEVVRPARIAWGNGFFVTSGFDTRAYSDDGISWTVLASSGIGAGVEFIDGRFITTGYRSVHESDPVTQMLLLGGTRIELRSRSGKEIRIEAADDVATGDWEEIGPGVVMDEEGRGSYEISVGGGKRFFRAVMRD